MIGYRHDTVVCPSVCPYVRLRAAFSVINHDGDDKVSLKIIDAVLVST